MALALRHASLLKPEIRLAQAVSEFEASLDSPQKASFRNERSTACTKSPTEGDVMRFTAEIDRQARQKRLSSRCFGPRLTNLLQSVQQFAALGDVVVGGSQNLVACGVWAAVRMTLHICIGFSSYLEKLSLLFMAAGRQAPRHQALALVYPKSKELQNHLCEYFIVVTQICHRVQSFARKSTFGQLTTSLNDSDIKNFQSDLVLWSTSIKEEVDLLLNKHHENEAHLSAKARALAARWSASTAHRYDIEKKSKWLDSCSTYDFQTTWKQMQKVGSTSLLARSSEYRQWKELHSSTSILFSGKIGAGKSVTMANVVNDLSHDKEAIVLYFFCRYDIPESLNHRTILGSLARQYLTCFPIGSDVFADDLLSPQLGVEDFVHVLRLGSMKHKQAYIIVDGLDDCSAEERRIVLSQLREIQPSSKWHLGVSAQFSADQSIKTQLDPMWNIILPNENPDIEFFIDLEIQARLKDGRLAVQDPGLIQDIKTALIEGANGMFLWVALQLDAICWENSDFDVRAAIKSLPRDLETTYARILERSTVRDSHKYYVRILKFLAAAYEPLTTAQIREMASVTIGQDNYDPRRQINNITNLLAFCGSLVMTDEEEGTVRFVHHSAKSFCQGSLGEISIWHFTAEEAHNELGGTILTYLNYSIFGTKLSRHVIPEVDAGKISAGVIRQTLHDSKRPVRIAGNFFKPKAGQSRRIGHILAQASKDSGIVIPDHPFLVYARKFWLLHTRYMIEPSTQRLWHNLINDVDISKLRNLPFVADAWVNVEVPQEPASFAGIFWSIQNSHIPMFNRAINLGKYGLSFSSQCRRILALRRMFKSLSSLSMSSSDNPTISTRSVIETHMAKRLRLISTLLNTSDFTKWIELNSGPAKCGKELANNADFLSISGSSLVSFGLEFHDFPVRHELDATMTQVAVFRGFPAALGGPRTYILLPKYPIHDLRDSPISTSQALLHALQSNIPREALLRKCASFLQKELDLKSLGSVGLYSILNMLAGSRELNPLVTLPLKEKVWSVIEYEDEMRNQIFRRACLMGNFDMAMDMRPTVRRVSASFRPRYRGDEIYLVLQTISEERFRLAMWLAGDVASFTGSDFDASKCDCSVLRRAVLLRNWNLASTLLEYRVSTTGLSNFVSRIESAHFCVLHTDLDGIVFLAKATNGEALNTISAGPVFEGFGPMQLAAFKESDWCRVYSIRTLMAEGARLRSVTADSFVLSVEEKLEMLVVSTGQNSGQHAGSYIHSLKTCYGTEHLVPVSSKIICLVATLMRKFVSTYVRALSRPLQSEETVLGYFSDSLILMRIFFESTRASSFHIMDLTLALRETIGALSHLDGIVLNFPTLGGPSNSTILIWKVQMRLLQAVDLLLRYTMPVHFDQGQARTNTMTEVLCADLLHTSIAFKPTSFNGESSRSADEFTQQFDHFQNIIEDVFYADCLPWLLQCALILGTKFQEDALVEFTSNLDLTYLSDSWFLNGQNSHQIPLAIREVLRSMGCRADVMNTLDEVLLALSLIHRSPSTS